MNWMEGLQAAINYIEEHLTENEVLSPASIAAAAYSSEDNFRKIFHLVTGYTIGEYIRNRRLSLAGEEILLTDHRILDIAIAYGYDSAESFTKAFCRFHGNTPSTIRRTKTGIRSFTRLVLKITAEGGSMLTYQLLSLPELTLIGYSQLFPDSSSDENNLLIPNFVQQCCEHHWNALMQIPVPPSSNNYLFGYRDTKNSIPRYNFGRITTTPRHAEELPTTDSMTHITIPKRTWVCFECFGSSPVDMQNLWYKIYTEFLPFSSYHLTDDLTLECSNITVQPEKRFLLLPVGSDNS